MITTRGNCKASDAGSDQDRFRLAHLALIAAQEEVIDDIPSFTVVAIACGSGSVARLSGFGARFSGVALVLGAGGLADAKRSDGSSAFL